MSLSVTVAITTFNQADYIGAAIRSVLDQSYRDVEIVVVDDGSTDDTSHEVSRFHGAVRLIRQENRGVAGARNRAVQEAEGDLVAFLDGDDLWHPAKLSRQIALYERHPDVGLIACDVRQFDGDRVLWEHSIGDAVFPAHAAREAVGEFYPQFVERNLISTTSQVMVPTAVLRQVGASRETLAVASDYDLYLRIASRYRVAFLHDVLTSWRYVPTSVSGHQDLRELRWSHDMLAVLRGHVREAAAAAVPMIRARIAALEREVAWRAYQLGLRGHQRAAREYLRGLVARGRMRPAAYYVAVSVPPRVRETVHRTVERLRPRAKTGSARLAGPRPIESEWRGQRRISAIVCTRNRAHALDRCLDSFAAVDFDPARWELIIVNNGSSDHTDDVVRAFAARVPFPVLLVHEPATGLSGARNRGVMSASSPLLAFTDDDCAVAPDYLRRLVAGFDADPTCGYIGGRILLHDPTDAPETIKLDREPADVPAFTCVRPGFIHGANLAVRRQAFWDVQGFDTLLGPGRRFCADDIDFIGRVSAAGWKGRYLPGPVVSHHHGRKPGPDLDRLRVTYARGRGAYFTKGCLNPRMRQAYLRGWYWHLRLLVKRGQARTAVREIAAGVEYLLCRFTSQERTQLQQAGK